MPRVPVHTVDDAPEESRETLGELEQRFGKVINIFGEMAHAPAVLETYAAMERTLKETSSLGERVRQAIHLTVANVNACDYCQAAYTGAAKATGFSDDETVAIRRGELPGDDELTALLQVSREIAANKGHVEDGTWKTALEAGWSEKEVLEAYADVVRTILTNYFNHLVGTEVDLPAPPAMDRVAEGDDGGDEERRKATT
ncbi:MAG: carboxymuconolactone decarboxylase family protein [Actinobacteria bacterium]|nr:carboxymuconolactone decarboxylase family protein [Actinomycetota bacterium]